MGKRLAGFRQRLVDGALQERRGAEHQHPAWADRHFLPSLGVTADTLPLAAHGEIADRRDFDLSPRSSASEISEITDLTNSCAVLRDKPIA
jgi:hypothetical protein